MSDRSRPAGRQAPRILVATNALHGGGAQRVNQAIAQGLAALGAHASILTVRPAPRSAIQPTAIGPDVIDLGIRAWPRWTRAPLVLLRLLGAVRHQRVDAVISGSFGLNQILLLARLLRILRVPVVVVEHLGVEFRLDVLGRRNRGTMLIMRRILRALYRRGDAIVAVSHGVAREFERVLELPADSVRTVYNPIDVRSIRESIGQRPSDSFADAFETLPRPIVVSAGRLEPQKDHRTFLRAFSLLPEEDRGTLLILGEGSLRSELTAASLELGIADRVHLPGHMENPWWFMARSDVFALSSRYEGFALVLAEALACGLPVVATDCPSGPREILAGIPETWLTEVGEADGLRHAISAALHARRHARRAPDDTDADPFHLRRFEPGAAATSFDRIVRGVLDRS